MEDKKLKKAMESLENGIREIFKDHESLRGYLDFAAGYEFYRYPYMQTVLIMKQNPGASMVAGPVTWFNRYERSVMPEEKENGIDILTPAVFKKYVTDIVLDKHKKPVLKDGKIVEVTKEIPLPAYTVVTVYDIEQTIGKEVEQKRNEETAGGVSHVEDAAEYVASRHFGGEPQLPCIDLPESLEEMKQLLSETQSKSYQLIREMRQARASAVELTFEEAGFFNAYKAPSRRTLVNLILRGIKYMEDPDSSRAVKALRYKVGSLGNEEYNKLFKRSPLYSGI